MKLLTGTVMLVADAGRVKALTTGLVVSAGAVTVNELVFTVTSPWALPESFMLPCQAAFQVYVPGVAGAGALRTAGKVVEWPIPLALPLEIATCLLFWS